MRRSRTPVRVWSKSPTCPRAAASRHRASTASVFQARVTVVTAALAGRAHTSGSGRKAVCASVRALRGAGFVPAAFLEHPDDDFTLHTAQIALALAHRSLGRPERQVFG